MGVDITLETFEWRGQARYRCPACTFDGPDVADVLRHWSVVHTESSQGPAPTLFDSDGKEIDRTIYAPKLSL